MNAVVQMHAPPLLPDLVMAAEFVKALTGSADTPCTWQTFDDSKAKRGSLARVLHGALAECAPQLQALNDAGAGVFVTVNETDLKGRKAENIVSVRSLPQDFDADDAGDLFDKANAALQFSICVQSSDDRYHGYWGVKDVPLGAFRGLQERLNDWTGADPSVKDLPRVLRLPGFWHMKDPKVPFMTKLEFVDADAVYTMADIETVLAQVEPAAPRPDAAKADQSADAPGAAGAGGSNDPKKRAAWPRVEAALRHVPNSPEHPREHWTTVAHAVRNACGPEHAEQALRMFIAWSQQWGEQAEAAQVLWAGLQDRADAAAGMGTLVHLAREAGWDDGIPADLAMPFVEAAIDSGDPGAMFEPEVLQVVRALSAADYARLRAKLKALKGFALTPWEKALHASADAADAADGGAADKTLADKLIAQAREQCEFAHTADGDAVAIVASGDVRQVYLVRASPFKEWLQGLFLRTTGKGCSSATMTTALDTLQAVGVHEGPEVEVHRRWAWADGALFVDLCDSQWTVIRIDADGWRSVGADAGAPLFVRGKKMRPLPQPVPLKGPLSLETFDPLWKVVNIPPVQRLLFLAALCECCRPNTPHLVLEFLGVQGSAKSSTQRRVRDLLDPNELPLRGAPKDVESIYIAAANSYVASFENLSHLPPEHQDALCALTTGAGWGKRANYTDGEESALKGKAAVLLNGIAAVCNRPDLLDRSVLFVLPALDAAARRPEETIDAAWGVAYPAVFGALLVLLAATLKALPGAKLKELPRMADFALLGVAVARALGLKPSSFLDAYKSNRSDATERALESASVYEPLLEFIGKEPGKVWMGTMGKLLLSLRHTNAAHASGEHLPKSARGMGDALRRIAPALAQVGIVVTEHGHTRDGHTVTIKMTP